MQITIRMPNPTAPRKAAAIRAIELHTNRAFHALIVESHDYDPERVDVSGTVKGVGPKTWEKWTRAVRVALKKN